MIHNTVKEQVLYKMEHVNNNFLNSAMTLLSEL